MGGVRGIPWEMGSQSQGHCRTAQIWTLGSRWLLSGPGDKVELLPPPQVSGFFKSPWSRWSLSTLSSRLLYWVRESHPNLSFIQQSQIWSPLLHYILNQQRVDEFIPEEMIIIELPENDFKMTILNVNDLQQNDIRSTVDWLLINEIRSQKTSTGTSAVCRDKTPSIQNSSRGLTVIHEWEQKECFFSFTESKGICQSQILTEKTTKGLTSARRKVNSKGWKDGNPKIGGKILVD